MEYWICIDAKSAAGALMLSLKGKIGGATNVLQVDVMTHPLIVGKDFDFSIPGFVRLTHLRNPGTENPMPIELVLPSQALLLAFPTGETAGQPPAEQQTPPASLH